MLIKVPCFGQVISILRNLVEIFKPFPKCGIKIFSNTRITHTIESICRGIAKCRANVNAELLA